MKLKLSVVAFISLVIMYVNTSCTKDTTTTVTVNDTVTQYVNYNSTLYYLTAKQWILDTVYTGYTGAGTGSLGYARGGSNNLFDYDNNRDIYWADGTEDAFDNLGNYSPYTWSFVNVGDSVNFKTVGPSQTIYARILKLDDTHFNVYDSTNSRLDIQVYKP